MSLFFKKYRSILRPPPPASLAPVSILRPSFAPKISMSVSGPLPKFLWPQPQNFQHNYNRRKKMVVWCGAHFISIPTFWNLFGHFAKNQHSSERNSTPNSTLEIFYNCKRKLNKTQYDWIPGKSQNSKKFHTKN